MRPSLRRVCWSESFEQFLMILCQIACIAKNHVIGKNQKLPWHLPEDLSFFKRATYNHPLIMGRRTFQSLPRMLPGRPHIVISTSESLSSEVKVVSSLESAIEEARRIWQEASLAFVIGGQSVFSAAMPYSDFLLLTRLHDTYEGDCVFPDIPKYFSIEGRDEGCHSQYARYVYKNTRLDSKLKALPSRILRNFRLDCHSA